MCRTMRVMTYSYTLLHVTDVHAVADGLMFGTTDTTGVLRSAMDAALDCGQPIDAIVLSGDIADQGEEAAYRKVGGIVDAAARRLGAVVVAAMGNHDDRSALRAALLGAEPSTEPYDTVTWVGGLRLVTLDSSVPGKAHGELGDDQLTWLAAQLADPAPHGTVLTLHHPPVGSVNPLIQRILLRKPERLAEAIAGTDVRLVLCGHAHNAGAGMLAGVPVWVGPASSYAIDLMPPVGMLRSLPVHAFTRVDITPEAVLTSLVPLTYDPAVHEVPLATVLEKIGTQ